MASDARAARRRAERDAKRKPVPVPMPQVAPTGEQGVSIDVVKDGVLVSIHAANQVFTVKWSPHDCSKIAELLVAASRESQAVVETSSGLVVAKEMP